MMSKVMGPLLSAIVDTTKWTPGWSMSSPAWPSGAIVSTSTGQLSIGHDGSTWAVAIHSAAARDLRLSTTSVEVISVTAVNDASFEWGLHNLNGGEQYFGCYIWAGDFYVYRRGTPSGFSNVDLVSEPYSAATHRYQRIRHTSDDVLHFDVSADGITWREVTSKPAWAELDLATARHYLGEWDNGGAPVSAVFDNFFTDAR